MSSPIDRQVFKNKLKTDVEKIQPTSFELTELRNAVNEVFVEYGTTNFLSSETAFATAKAEGLSLLDITQVLNEVKRHISTQAHFEATRAHEQERSTAGWNIFKQMALNLKDAKTIFGGGVAQDVRTRAEALQKNDDTIKALLEGAIGLGVMRKRLQRYTELGGDDLKNALKTFKDGKADGKKITAQDLLDTNSVIGSKYDKGLNSIIAGLKIESGLGKKISIDGLGEVPVPDADTKAALEHHFKFVLRTEIIKLVEAEELAVLSSDEYNIAHPKTTAQKAWQVGKGLVASGTMWGVATRTGGRLLLGGALTTVGLTGGGAIIGGMMIGMAAGATAAYVRERVNAKERLKRRQLEAALGAVDDAVAKPAHRINAELKEKITALQTAKTPDEQVSAITATFAAVTNAQVRLRESRHHKQDYISFGIENRFKAQKQLLDNIEKALAALQQAMEQLSHEQQHTVQRALKNIPQEAEQQVWQARTEFTKQVQADEVQRRRRAVLVGSLAGGFGSLAARYVLDALHVGSSVAETATPTPLAAEQAAVIPSEQGVIMPNSEVINTDGKSVLIDANYDRYTVGYTNNHELTVTQFSNDGETVESVAKEDIAFVYGDDLQIVQTDTTARVFDDQGVPVADIKFGIGTDGASGDVTEQIFADPETKQMLDAMGLQPGELQYDPTTKLFHIPDDALHDAAGKPEYLGQTAGWRARRLEFILKALAEGKATETPDMIVARAERATASLLLKSPMHGDAAAAYAEAFTKDAGFIQKNIMPWIDGHRSRVSERWMKLVAEMKTQQLSVTADGEGGVVITLLNPDGSPIDTTTPASEATVQAAAAASEPFQDFVLDKKLQAGITLLTGLAAGAAWAYEYKGLGDVAHDPTRTNEYNSGDDYEVPETQLRGVGETVSAIKSERLNEAIAEKGPAIAAEINAFIAAADTAIGTKADELKKFGADLLSESFGQAHIDRLVASGTSVADITAKVGEARALLAKEVDGVKYLDIDAANGEALKKWIDSRHEASEQLATTVKEKVQAKVEGTAKLVTSTRKDSDKNSTTRRDELKTCLTDLAVANSLPSIVPAIIPDTAWQTAMETAAQAATAEAEQAIAVITIDKHISCDPKVAAFVNQELEKRGCLNSADPTLPQPDKARFIAKLAKKMEAYPESKTGLEQMGFMVTVGARSFKPEHETRITQVLDRLLNDEDDIFAK